jgi:hypothetical protein
MGKFLFFASFCVLFFAGCPQPQPVIIERPREEPRHEIVVPPQPNRNVIVAPQFGVVPRPYYGRPYYGQPHYAPPHHREPYAPNRQPYGGGNRGNHRR